MKKALIILAVICGIYAGSNAPLPIHSGGYVYAKNEGLEGKYEKVRRAEKFMSRYNPDAVKYAVTFVEAGEENVVDYRQLLAQAVLESTLFKRDSCQNNGEYNGFGYASNARCFKTQEEAIQFTARTLRNSGYYKGKSVARQLCVWQSGKDISDCPYAMKALRLMEGI
jgi:hypothetical protein